MKLIMGNLNGVTRFSSEEEEDSGGGGVVVVGVNLDGKSKELLTWALVKVARSGDRVIALHVLHPKTEEEDKGSLLSLVKAFDSMMSAYEGFCNLKQIDLKLKFCRGTPVRKILAREANSCGATSLILGTSEIPHRIRSSVSVAKSCARNLHKGISVIAVDNGKILFQRQATSSSLAKSPLSLPSPSIMSKEEKDTHNYEPLGKCSSLKQWIQFVSICPCDDNNTYLNSDEISKKLPQELEGLSEKYSSTCRVFTYQELVSATSNFLPENLIGKGGTSEVYRGSLPDGSNLAVKILKSPEDVMKQFVSEIEMITSINHKNIISLIGFCFENNNLLLVYDLLQRGSLEENLHGIKMNKDSFSWRDRYKVALGIAEALNHLHSSSDEAIIHRDVKSSNILLSDDFEPRLSDFGLATLASNSSCDVDNFDIAGTFGYLAPEYFMDGRLNEKIDVYAFGVVLLELLSGRKPIDNGYPKGQESVVMWAKQILKEGNILELVDPGLNNIYDNEQFDKMVLAASLCIRRAPLFRPEMSVVVKLLEGDLEVVKWAEKQVNILEEAEAIDDEQTQIQSPKEMQSFYKLALLNLDDGDDIDDDESRSSSSTEQMISVEDYLQGRWSRASSFK